VSRQDLSGRPAASLSAEIPQLDLTIASTGNKASRGTRLVSACTDDLAWCNGWGPRNAVYATTTCLEDLVCPRIVFELEDRDVAVRRSTGEKAAGFMWRPGDDVDRGGVEGDFVDLLPCRRLLAPDDDFAVV
jgi:hypothetical protein